MCKTLQNKVEEQIVWHEFGHIFGFYISQKLGYNFGKITKIELNEKPYSITLKGSPYDLLGAKDWEQLKINLNKDTKQLLVYFLYVLSGAVFNIAYFKQNPDLEDFEKIFLKDEKVEKVDSYVARAGNDFYWIHGCWFDLSWGDAYDFNNFKSMALECFYLLQKHSIFCCLQSVMVEFERDLNGFTTTDSVKIRGLLEVIEKMIEVEQQKKLLSEINDLLNKYIAEIETTKK
ncbi:MAG: hypothetical protein LBU90_03975 [Bacteroidales bacterium]|jgi:hypothetical protein|nr:hypothetical protein [Bacteroidales bacterium]